MTCNVCKEENGRRRKGRCMECERAMLKTVAEVRRLCFVCGDEPRLKHTAVVRSSKRQLLHMCFSCYEGADSSVDNYPDTKIAKRRCVSCKGEVVKFSVKKYCNKCRKIRDLKSCEMCLKEVSILYTQGNYTLCSTCMSTRFFNCAVCEKESLKLDGLKIDGEMVCVPCYKIVEKSIKSYGYKPPPEFQPPIINTDSLIRGMNELYLGVELEVVSPKPSLTSAKVEALGAAKVYNKSDSSIGRGFEVVSHPMTLKYHMEEMNWKALLQLMVDNKCLSHNTKTCGIHIHINKDFLRETERIRFQVFINSHMKEFTKLARRNKGEWAKYKKIDRADFKKVTNKYGHGGAVNWNNAKTVEIRIFKGTLRYSTFIAALQLIDATARYVKVMPKNPVSAYNVEVSWNAFIDFIVKENKAFIRGEDVPGRYEELVQYMKEKKLFSKVKVENKSIDQILQELSTVEVPQFDEEIERGCV